MLKKLKSYMMPISMLVGGIFYQYTGYLSIITPYLIAVMLFITYCNISLRDIRLSRLHALLLSIQLLGSISIYILLLPLNPFVAQGAMICIFAPTATSAPVIGKMLGGNIESLTAYSLLSNMAIIIVAPLFFTCIGKDFSSVTFFDSVYIISQKILLLLFVPFVLAIATNKFLPRVGSVVKTKQGISFYLWTVALIIITGRTVQFIVDQDGSNYTVEIVIALVASVICIAQFALGRRIGRIYNDTVAGGQGLGQKNTILAIWMAQTYLSPISSIGPGSYVLWQNLINSYQVWRQRKRL